MINQIAIVLIFTRAWWVQWSSFPCWCGWTPWWGWSIPWRRLWRSWSCRGRRTRTGEGTSSGTRIRQSASCGCQSPLWVEQNVIFYNAWQMLYHLWRHIHCRNLLGYFSRFSVNSWSSWFWLATCLALADGAYLRKHSQWRYKKDWNLGEVLIQNIFEYISWYSSSVKL